MSVIATAVRHLMVAGVTGEALIDAIAEMEADIRAEPKPRTAGAIRQERYRERNKPSQVTECDASDGTEETAPLSLPPNDINSNPPTHTPVNNTTRAREAFPKPEWCDPQVWRDLKANRKAKRLPCTATAHAKLLRDLEKLSDDDWPPGKLLEAIVGRGWAAAYDPRDDRKANHDRPSKNYPNQRQGTRAIAERVAARMSAAGRG